MRAFSRASRHAGWSASIEARSTIPTCSRGDGATAAAGVSVLATVVSSGGAPPQDATMIAPATTAASDTEELAILAPEVRDVRLDPRRASARGLDHLRRRERAPVAVDVLDQPGAERDEIARRDSLRDLRPGADGRV